MRPKKKRAKTYAAAARKRRAADLLRARAGRRAAGWRERLIAGATRGEDETIAHLADVAIVLDDQIARLSQRRLTLDGGKTIDRLAHRLLDVLRALGHGEVERETGGDLLGPPEVQP